MKKFVKNLLIVGLPFLSLALILSFLLSENQEEISAQTSFQVISQKIICDEPIPIGNAIETTLSLMTDIYGEFQETRGYLLSAIGHLEAETAELFKNPEEVCDFMLCEPDVSDQGIDGEFKIANTEITVETHIPLCHNNPCRGNPCPDLEKYIDEITILRNSVNGCWEKIRDIFTIATIPIPENLKEDGESNILLTKPELASRELRSVRQWLYPTVGSKRSCSLSELERVKVEAGEMGNIYPMRCTDALNQGTYWPRAWSEECDDECKEGPTEGCVTCLKTKTITDNSSPLAKINYKIYVDCLTDCEKGIIAPECFKCLCEDKNERECTSWLCGGSYYNYVCCHEHSLERE